MAKRSNLFFSAAVGAFMALISAAQAESLMEALASAYANNPSLNAARAGVRATDEGVPQALAGYRPRITGQLQAGGSWTDTNGRLKAGVDTTVFSDMGSMTASLTIVQPIYTGGRVANGVKAAEAAVKAARENLRYTEQTTLLNAVSAYMNVIATRQLLDLRRSNVQFLQEQVRAASDRFTVGEGTKTDVSQAEAALAGAESAVSTAQANSLSAAATFLQVVGHKPSNLAAASPVVRLLPNKLDVAVSAARTDHPAILAALHNADAAAYNVSIAEGELLPTLSVQGSVSKTWSDGVVSSATGMESSRTLSGSIMGVLSVPIYQGGAEYSAVRQAKEQLGQAKIQVDSIRDQVNTALISSWGNLEASKAQIEAAKASVEASKLALDGVIEEQKVGQRTTLDVLNAQSTLIESKAALVNAQTGLVVNSYAVLSVMGRLDRERLGLQVAAYKPEQHYTQVRDKWIGLRTPDGR